MATPAEVGFDHARAAVTSINRDLLAASRVIIDELAMPAVLHRIVEAACRLTHARYGALGIRSSARGWDQFVWYGVDDRAAALIGDPPGCTGVLGLLFDDPRPLRLDTIGDHPASVGFPPHHPPMTSLLGVPIRVRQQVFADLYLADSERGRFGVGDEQLIGALADVAGVAIDNARLYEQARRREQWQVAAAMIGGQLLSGEGEDPLGLVASQARSVADADVVTVALATPDGAGLMVEVASGPGVDELIGMRFPAEGSLAGLAFGSRRPTLVDDVTEDGGLHVHLSRVVRVGPAMVLPLNGRGRMRGALVVGRRRGRRRFDESDLGMATTFANQAAIALELADAREAQQRMMLLEDRERIARDLHDHVIQRLFATGLTVQAVAGALGDDGSADRLSRVVADLDATARQIRTSIFDLRGPIGPRPATVRVALSAVLAEVSPVLGFEPDIRFAGPIDTAIPDDLVVDLAAMLREALTNVARHAHATRVEVELDVSATGVRLRVSDDGVGMGAAVRRSGLANLADRAAAHGGTLTVTGAAPGGGSHESEGARLTWASPLR